MPLALQSKLLRVLEENEVRAVGLRRRATVDVRVIAATHKDLRELVRMRAFREDLYFRLNVVSITVPPLRDRVQDIPLLVERFLGRAVGRNPTARVSSMAPELVAALARLPWPGNVRELENMVERLVIIGTQACATVADLEATMADDSAGTRDFDLRRERSRTAPTARVGVHLLGGVMLRWEQDPRRRALGHRRVDDSSAWARAERQPLTQYCNGHVARAVRLAG